ncbi:MAG: peptidoglycan-binding protein [Hyphomicrobium sp.]|nr:peptidoglycan-binding protein [Hyphomicrobium sp.]
MKYTARKSLVGAAAAAMMSIAAPAWAAPDLIIQQVDTDLKFVGCEVNQPLVEGTIVIRNNGDSEANLREASDLFRSFVAIYNPENIDLIEKDTKRTKMEPKEQRSITISMGGGKVKKGRNYNAFPEEASSGFPTDKDWLTNRSKYEVQIKKVQQFLKDRGYAISKIDGKWGSSSKSALKAFQSQVGLSATGDWSEATGMKIAELGGGAPTATLKNIVDSQGRTKITVFAVVDPYNLIEESNENNNILALTGYVPGCEK